MSEKYIPEGYEEVYILAIAYLEYLGKHLGKGDSELTIKSEVVKTEVEGKIDKIMQNAWNGKEEEINWNSIEPNNHVLSKEEEQLGDLMQRLTKTKLNEGVNEDEFQREWNNFGNKKGGAVKLENSNFVSKSLPGSKYIFDKIYSPIITKVGRNKYISSDDQTAYARALGYIEYFGRTGPLFQRALDIVNRVKLDIKRKIHTEKLLLEQEREQEREKDMRMNDDWGYGNNERFQHALEHGGPAYRGRTGLRNYV